MPIWRVVLGESILKINQTTGSATPLRLPSRGAAPSRAGETDPRIPASSCSGGARELPPAESFDAAKVAAIREEIRAGRYKVDPERIADGMLASVREMLAGQKA